MRKDFISLSSAEINIGHPERKSSYCGIAAILTLVLYRKLMTHRFHTVQGFKMKDFICS